MNKYFFILLTGKFLFKWLQLDLILYYLVPVWLFSITNFNSWLNAEKTLPLQGRHYETLGTTNMSSLPIGCWAAQWAMWKGGSLTCRGRLDRSDRLSHSGHLKQRAGLNWSPTLLHTLLSTKGLRRLVDCWNMIKLKKLTEEQQVLGACFQKGTHFQSPIPKYFLGWDVEETSRKAEFEGENKVPWSLNPDTIGPYNN